jgi:hypothetical protein
MIEEKNVQSKKYQLGQFFTPVELAEEILTKLNIDSDIVIEPSFGACGFIQPMLERYSDAQVVGIEIDKDLYNTAKTLFPDTVLYNKNFYDIDEELKFNTKKVTFIGNVPFRSPAFSLTTHRDYVKKLAHRYNVKGIREEAVFFIVKTADIMITNNYQGGIHYIIPKSLITNDSKFYLQFKKFLKKYFKIVSVFDVDPNKFENVAQGLIMLSMETGGDDSNYAITHNGVEEPVDTVLQMVNTDITFQQIFKKTYLGSVPAESFLVSVSGESKTDFKDRLVKIFDKPTTASSLKVDLAYNGKYHLKVLSGKNQNNIDVKLQQIANYINEVKQKIDVSIFKNIDNYKIIQQRKETRFYFRHSALKKCSFVYELNPNPCPSFYFTSNPSAGSTDYFGYCDYDITRNSSPGCCRTVPLCNFSNNVTDFFKNYWKTNAGDLPLEMMFSYIQYVSASSWYKQQKKLRKRFYFCVPTIFMKEWLNTVDLKNEAQQFLNFKNKTEIKPVQENMFTQIFEQVG